MSQSSKLPPLRRSPARFARTHDNDVLLLRITTLPLPSELGRIFATLCAIQHFFHTEFKDLSFSSDPTVPHEEIGVVILVPRQY